MCTTFTIGPFSPMRHLTIYIYIFIYRASVYRRNNFTIASNRWFNLLSKDTMLQFWRTAKPDQEKLTQWELRLMSHPSLALIPGSSQGSQSSAFAGLGWLGLTFILCCFVYICIAYVLKHFFYEQLATELCVLFYRGSWWLAWRGVALLNFYVMLLHFSLCI